MTSSWRSRPAVPALLALPLALLLGGAAPRDAAAQGIREIGFQVVATASDPVLGAGGVYGGFRLSERVRLAGTVSAGVSDEELATRGELLLHFLLNPRSAQRPGAYAGAGVAGVWGPVDRGYVVLLLGLEARPGAGSGWFAEAGVGGGARIAAGWRWRW